MDDDPAKVTGDKMRGALTVALTIAARIAEVQLHRRATEAREEALRGREEAQRASERARAEAGALRSRLRLEGVGREQWWNEVTAEKLAVVYTAVRAHGKVDGDLAGTASYLAEQIQRRYQVNADELVAGVELRERERRQLAEQQAAAERAEAARRAAHAADPANFRHWSAWQREQVEAGRGTVTEGGAVLPPSEVERERAERAAAERAARERAAATVLTIDADLADVMAATDAEWARFIEQVRPGGDEPTAAVDAQHPVGSEAWEEQQNAAVDVRPTDEPPAMTTAERREALAGALAGAVPPAAESVVVWDEAARRAAVIERINRAGLSAEARESRVILGGLHGKPVAAMTGDAKPARGPAKPRNAPEKGKKRTRHR